MLKNSLHINLEGGCNVTTISVKLPKKFYLENDVLKKIKVTLV